MMLVYHRTDDASAIERDGFRDSDEPGKAAGEMAPGVWVSADRPLSEDEFPHGRVVLQLEIPEALFREYEWDNAGLVGYREALIPAAEINRYLGTLRRVAAEREGGHS